jgi:hypothetical protein
MTRRFFLNNLRLVLVGFLAFAIGLQPELSSGAETYKQDAGGLEKQFDAFLKTYHKRADEQLDGAFSVFRMPNAAQWFAENFSAEDAARLSKAYGQQVSDAANSLAEDMNMADPGGKFRVHCEPRGEIKTGAAKDGSDVAAPLKPIHVEQFVMQFESTGNGRKFLFMANFVFLDGAYRYVGGGGTAFWAKPGLGAQ